VVILSKDWLRLRIGKLGIHDFPPGYYVYVGNGLLVAVVYRSQTIPLWLTTCSYAQKDRFEKFI